MTYDTKIEAQHQKSKRLAKKFAAAWSEWLKNSDPMPSEDFLETASALLEHLGAEVKDPEDK